MELETYSQQIRIHKKTIRKFSIKYSIELGSKSVKLNSNKQ